MTSKRYNIEILNKRPGLYFIQRQPIILATESWTIAVDVNLEDIENKLLQLKSIWEITWNLRNKTDGTIWTNAQFQGTNTILKNTEAKLGRLHELVGVEVKSPRRKRGLINSIGFGLKTLFGTMDSDDAEYYNEKISTIDSNQHRVYQLEKDQLTLVRRTLKEVSYTLTDVKDNQNTIIKTQLLLEELQNLTQSNFETYKEQLEVYNKIVSALQVIELSAREIDEIVTELYLAIDSMRHTFLSILLITPDDLAKYLKDISVYLKSGSTLPIIVTNQTIHEYYELIQVTALLVDNHILRFFLNVPLALSARPFDMYEIYPLLTPMSETNYSLCTFIQPHMNFLAISNDETRFLPMTQEQLKNNCKGNKIKICFGPNVVNNIINGLETCEIAYFKQLNPPENSCDHRMIYLFTSAWIEIKQTNQWMFTLPKEELITVTCPGQDGYPELEGNEWTQGTGIITLPPSCQMRGSTFTIHRRVVYKNKLDSNITSRIKMPKPSKVEINLKDDKIDIVVKKLRNLTSHIKHVTTSLDDLSSASVRLDLLDSIMNKYEPNNFVNYQTHYVSYVTLLVIIVFIIYYFNLWKICKKRTRKNTQRAVEYSGANEERETNLDEMPLEERIKLSRRNNAP